MSRTYRGSKGIGYEPWSKRPFNKGGGVIGSYHKTRTHRAERKEGVEQVKSGEKEYKTSEEDDQ